MPFFPVGARLRTLADVDQATAPGDGESPAWSTAADRFAWAAGGGGAPYATMVVAAANSVAAGAAGADFVCSGADDQDTINAAIAQVAATGVFGLVLLLEGTYSLSGGIDSGTGFKPVAVAGMGSHATILRRDAAFSEAVIRLRSGGSVVSDLQVDGNFAGGGGGVHLGVGSVRHVLATNIGTGTAIFVQGESLVESCQVVSVEGRGIDANLGDCVIVGNVIGDTGFEGINHNVGRCIIASNLFVGFCEGNAIREGGTGRITGNIGAATQGHGILLAGPQSLVTGNIVAFAQGSGIHVNVGANGNYIAGNTVMDAPVGVHTSASADNIVVGNDLRGATTAIDDTLGVGTILTFPGHATFGDNFT